MAANRSFCRRQKELTGLTGSVGWDVEALRTQQQDTALFPVSSNQCARRYFLSGGASTQVVVVFFVH